jgi:hypothetical protein
MSVKAGKVITLGNGFLVERAQSVGAPNLNIPLEKIKETGNELNVSTERDIPDLTFDIESLDATIDTEAMLCNIDPLTLSNGDVLTLAQAMPLDVVSPYKAAGTSKTSNGGVVWSYLTLMSATWRFGVGTQGATQTFSLMGDNQYQGNKTPYREVFIGPRAVTDGATTNTDATVTSATAAFTAADVGRGITGAGVPAATTILSVTNATTIEMSANATATATGVTLTIVPDGTFAFAETAVKTVEEGDDLYALSACLYHADGTYTRLFNLTDYTSTATEIALVDPTALLNGDTLAVTYFSATTADFEQVIHSTPSVKPGKIKGKNINLYVAVAPHRSFNAGTTNADATLTAAGGAFTSADVGAKVMGTGIPAGATIASVTSSTEVELSATATATAASVVVELSPPLIRWGNVQSVDLNWRVQLEKDEELGNAHVLSQDYDTPDVSGSITLRPGTNANLFDKIAQVTGADPDEISNVLAQNVLEMQIRLENPRTGDTLKTFKVDDAQILPPGAQARAGQKLENQFQWTSDSGELEIIKGDPV